MKRTFLILVMVLSVLFCAGCGASGGAGEHGKEQEKLFNQLAEEFFPWLSLEMGMKMDQLDAGYVECGNDYPGAISVMIDDPSYLQNGFYTVVLTFAEGKGLCGVIGISSESYLDTITEKMGPSTMNLMYHNWLQDGVFVSCEEYDVGGSSVIFFTEERAEIEFSADMAGLNGTQTSPGTEESEFVSDWTADNANAYGYGSTYNATIRQVPTADDYRFITQGDWVYYMWIGNGIYKMPVNATDGSQVCKLASLDGHIYNLSVMKDWLYYFENDQLVRLRTDGMVRESMPLQSEEIRDTDGFYLAHDQLYYISKTHRSASEFAYELRSIDLDTMEDISIAPDVRKIIRGYKDSLFIQTPEKDYQRIDLSGNLLAEYEYDVPGYLLDEDMELFTGIIDEDGWGYDESGCMLINGNIVENEALADLLEHNSDHYVCLELGKIIYSAKKPGSESEYSTCIYCAHIQTLDTIILNEDRTEAFYSWGDGYIYYPAWINGDGRSVPIFCRILPDGTGWEDVSWMFY